MESFHDYPQFNRHPVDNFGKMSYPMSLSVPWNANIDPVECEYVATQYNNIKICLDTNIQIV